MCSWAPYTSAFVTHLIGLKNPRINRSGPSYTYPMGQRVPKMAPSTILKREGQQFIFTPLFSRINHRREVQGIPAKGAYRALYSGRRDSNIWIGITDRIRLDPDAQF